MHDLVQFEILPLGSGEEEAARVTEHVRLTVTCSPKHGPHRTVEVATRLRALGHTVTVHLAARMIRDRAHLDDLLGAMARAGIDDAFVIGGDATPPAGSFSSAVELLPVVHEHPNRPHRIGIAGYPEGHPLIAAEELAEALARKAGQAEYVTTQLCFDPDALVRWVEQTRAAGIHLPVFVGLPGVVDRRRLLEISMRVGVGPSLAFLRKQRGIRNLLRPGFSLDRLHDAIEPYVGESHLNIVGFHYYTFNRLVDTWTWAQRRLGEQRESTMPDQAG